MRILGKKLKTQSKLYISYRVTISFGKYRQMELYGGISNILA